MPTLTFVQGDLPLTKTIGAQGTTPYPLIKNLTSYTQDVQTITEFYDAIHEAAAHGHALMKGPFNHKLRNESRTSCTLKDHPTDWVCLDIDGAEGITVPEILSALGLADVDHIVQYSASSLIKPGVHAHIFMMLDAPISPMHLKRLFQHYNLTVPLLRSRLTLNKNKLALRYPLDIVTADNSRMLFIGTPTFVAPVLDPHPADRIIIRRGSKTHATLPLPPDELTLRARIAEMVESLRPHDAPRALNKWVRSKELDEDVAIPDMPAKVSGVRDVESSPFVYVNLNGGDSWAYYYRRDNPEYLFNFKGEPTYPLAAICPSLNKDVDSQVFIDSRTEAFLLYHDGELIEQRTRQGLQAIMNSFNLPMPNLKELTTIRQIYNPTLPNGFQTSASSAKRLNVYNTYIPPIFVRPPTNEFPNIDATLRHVCVDDETYGRFLNWLAFIIQSRSKAKTAWIFTGVPGTGKGIMTDMIIKSLVGQSNYTIVSKEVLESAFNDYVSGNLMVIFDEAKFDPATDRRVDHKLKILITSDSIEVNRKGVAATMMDSHSNVILTSNEHEVARLAPNDRRFNIAPRQEQPIIQKYPNYEDMVDAIPGEVSAFYYYLMAYRVNKGHVGRVVMSQARAAMIEMNIWDVEAVSNALLNGNREFFLAAVRAPSEAGVRMVLQQQYNTLMSRMGDEPTTCFTLHDLSTIYQIHCARIPLEHTRFRTTVLRSGLRTQGSYRNEHVPVTWNDPV